MASKAKRSDAAQRPTETALQYRSRLAAERVKGEVRDIISPFRLQHDAFEQATVQDGRSRNVVQRKVNLVAAMHSEGRLSDNAAKALTIYRNDWDLLDRSCIRSCCDNSPKGEGDGIDRHIDSKKRLRAMQLSLGTSCGTHLFELIVCHDKTFSATSREIYGDESSRDTVRRQFDAGRAVIQKFLDLAD